MAEFCQRPGRQQPVSPRHGSAPHQVEFTADTVSPTLLISFNPLNQRTLEARSRNPRCRGKAIGITYYECVCVYSLIYPACKVHAPSCRLCPVWLYHIFPHYLVNGTI
jgi:hypothetical protein